MQKVKFQAETGAELRKQMMDFLGLDGQIKISGESMKQRVEALAASAQRLAETEKQETETPVSETETPVEETKTRKRRSKAEIEAEKASAKTITPEDAWTEEYTGGVKETPVVDVTPVVDETPVVEETGPKVTKESLTPLVLTLGRAGRKAEVVALLSKYVQADGVSVVTGLPNLQPSDYQAFHDEITAL